MSYKFNPLTGKLDFVDTTSSSGSIASSYIVDTRTITLAESIVKEVVLPAIPSDNTKVTMDIVGGTSQVFGIDFTIVGDKLSWLGLGLDLTLGFDDKIRIIYPL